MKAISYSAELKILMASDYCGPDINETLREEEIINEIVSFAFSCGDL